MRSVVVCTTCKYSPISKTGPDGRTGGEMLLAHVRDEVAERDAADVTVEAQACLWNCARPCSVVLRDATRFSYITGGHEPTRAQAQAIVDWFAAHSESERGEVPFRQWPERMKGHFIARVPPEPQ
jgi:predicted metal-binding protein